MPNTAISEENKAIARAVADAFGGKPKITRFWDDDRKSHVDIAACNDRPQDGVTSFSTLSLSDAPLHMDGEEYKARVELVGACGNAFQEFDSALATAAFCIINSHWFCYPGRIFPDVLSMYECSSTMQHLLFVPPFLWEDRLQTLDLKTKTVAWLLAVPISEPEASYAQTEGSDKLVALFSKRQIDVFDLERSSIL